jgi:hypothetical protein
VSVARNDRRDDRKRKEQMLGRRNKTNFKHKNVTEETTSS